MRRAAGALKQGVAGTKRPSERVPRGEREKKIFGFYGLHHLFLHANMRPFVLCERENGKSVARSMIFTGLKHLQQLHISALALHPTLIYRALFMP